MLTLTLTLILIPQVASDVTCWQLGTLKAESPAASYLPSASPLQSPTTAATEKVRRQLQRLSTPASTRRTGMDRIPWTQVEIDELTRLIDEHGAGNWKKIYLLGIHVFCQNRRSTVDLKDKWRGISKQQRTEVIIAICLRFLGLYYLLVACVIQFCLCLFIFCSSEARNFFLTLTRHAQARVRSLTAAFLGLPDLVISQIGRRNLTVTAHRKVSVQSVLLVAPP